jgi:HAE1 family hydrophobic/amphiphilic exporter-1
LNLPKLAIDRPVFMSCVVLLLLILGILAYSTMAVDLFPDVSFPFVIVTTPYQGASPEEIETQVSKPLEDEFSTIQGVKKVTSTNEEGFSVVMIQFNMDADVKDSEQQVKDHLSFVRPTLPKDIDEPIVRRLDPSALPIAQLSLSSTLPPAQAYDLADQVIKPQLAQVEGVGVISIQGGRKREIQVQLDRNMLNRFRISASQVATRIGLNGMNVPVGKVQVGGRDLLFRSVGQYDDLDRLKQTSVNFMGSDVSVPVERLGHVVDTVEDAQGYSYINGQSTLVIQVVKQSKVNTVQVVDGLRKRIVRINESLKGQPGSPHLEMFQDMAWYIRMNLEDVKFTIFQGVILTILVVFLFLGSFRSTLITITALPVSLFGAFFLMNAVGFTLNMMTLLALSLAVGLLIDDAIVVRENIWRHIEEGAEPKKAAVEATLEVALAVVATSSVVIAVFMPIAFLNGMVGQFFRQFGLTVCFAMAISLFEAMVMGPMLSAFWGRKRGKGFSLIDTMDHYCAPFLNKFDRFQDILQEGYLGLITWCLRHRFWVVLAAVLVFLGSLALLPFMKIDFKPAADVGQFAVYLKAEPATSLESMRDKTLKIEALVRQHPEVQLVADTIGGSDATGADQGSNKSNLYILMKPSNQRKIGTAELKEILRKELEPYRQELNPQVSDFDPIMAQAPFTLNLVGEDYSVLAPFALQVVEKIKGIAGLADVQSTYNGGKPEFQAKLDPIKLKMLGVSGQEAGDELRTQVEGATPAKFRQGGLEYFIRVRLQEDQRNLQTEFPHVLVPNQNGNLVRLSDIAQPVTTEGPSEIDREDRARYVQITGQLATGGSLGNVLKDGRKILEGLQMPKGVSYEFVGQAEDFHDLLVNMGIAVGLAMLFTFMILASLYESPIFPLAIMMPIPLAMVGALAALWAGGLFIPYVNLSIFSMIAIIMLMGLVTKNSILLVDYTLQMMRKGYPRDEALKMAGKVRLRPILMTTFALIAGMLPVALALTEVGKFRQSMGIAMEGGLISSLFLTLIIIPSVFGYVDDFRLWLLRISGSEDDLAPAKVPAKVGVRRK